MLNKVTKVAPFVVVYGKLPKKSMDLTNLVSNSRVADMLREIPNAYKWVKENIETTNVGYKNKVDGTHKFQVFKGSLL